MNIKTLTKSIILTTLSLFTVSSYAADFGVNLEWDTKKKQEAMTNMPSQGPSFFNMVKSGEIKEVYIKEKTVGNRDISFVNFVIEAKDEQEVKEKISTLPLYQKQLIKITAIVPVGAKWLDSTPTYRNYSLSFYWKENVDITELNRVLGVDLQRVVALNQAGLVTSSYLHSQDNGDGIVKPVYLIAVLANDETHALELSKQFESVRKGYVDVSVKYLGRKLNINKK